MNIADSYNISKNKKEELATILSYNSVVNQVGQNLTYEQIIDGLNRLFGGNEVNWEIKDVSIDDIRGDSGNYNAGAIVLHRTDGYNQAFFTNSETTINVLLKLYNLK